MRTRKQVSELAADVPAEATRSGEELGAPAHWPPFGEAFFSSGVAQTSGNERIWKRLL
jgi:hypothetical protein